MEISLQNWVDAPNQQKIAKNDHHLLSVEIMEMQVQEVIPMFVVPVNDSYVLGHCK
jgi:hypothetical protein